MSQFDPSAFLDATTTEASTVRPPLPAGADLVAVIGEPKVTPWQSKDGTKAGLRLDLPLVFDLDAYPDVKAAIGGSVNKVTITDGVMLDMTEAGTIDYGPGRNGKLRRYREALGLNVAGQPFSFRMLQGRQVKAKIKHDLYEGNVYEKIDSVSKTA